jgi:hypothetical protein
MGLIFNRGKCKNKHELLREPIHKKIFSMGLYVDFSQLKLQLVILKL